ncbi:MAG: hypothetical protein QW818_03605 [Candidatus Aenigmatarchaeota archaeon]|nr:hypothetical protein [Candidatus Aenigmarchaeota archaeon]
MALFRKKKDWKDELSDEDKQILSTLLDSTKKHRFAYNLADDIKIAQLWTALVELKKELNKTNELLGKVQEPWKAIVAVGEEEKRKTIEKLVQEIIKPVDETTQEATQKLVESLMKF